VTACVDEHRGRFGVEPICRTLGVSASAYFQRKTGARCRRAVEDERLLERVREIHAANYYAYGSRRMWIALTRAGEPVARCTVERPMRAHGIQGAKRRGTPWRTTRPDPAARRRPDLVDRDFAAAGPNELWVADISYLRCWEGVVFFAFIGDAWSHRVVGWQLAGHMRTTLVMDALRMALHQRGSGADVALVHHSDRGAQGGFKRCSQHVEREELRWRSRGGVGQIGSCARLCVLPVAPGWRVVRIGSDSGRRSRREWRVTGPACSPASRAWLASGGFVRVAGCDRSAGRRCRGGICRSRSVRRSRC
jgi:transposase InsO family protein